MSITRLYHKATFRFLKLLSVSVSAILGVFCNFGGCMYGPAPMYGMPSADYKITGTVQSNDLKLPVKGLSISLRDTLNKSNVIDSVRTDSLGKYSLEFSALQSENTWVLSVKDIDSTENGTFTTKDTIITTLASDLKDPSGDWNMGHADLNIDLNVDRDNQ